MAKDDHVKLTREELENMALLAVSPDDFYCLLDTLQETPDEDLWSIINSEQTDSPSPD